MTVSARLNNLRIAPRKVRLVADLIRGKTAVNAKNILNFAVKGGARPMQKLLNSAISNAKNNFQIEESNLYISMVTVDEGPKMKRWMARARGSANEIQKKTSHIIIVLDEIEKTDRKLKEVGKPQGEVREVKQEKGKTEVAAKSAGKIMKANDLVKKVCIYGLTNLQISTNIRSEFPFVNSY